MRSFLNQLITMKIYTVETKRSVVLLH